MRNIDLPKVTINGEEYPIYCDLYVLSKIQDRMDLNDFERAILGVEIVRDENGDPEYEDNGRIKLIRGKYDIDALALGLTLMINEGLIIDTKQTGIEHEPVDEFYIIRVCDIPEVQLSNIVHDAFGRCFSSKKKVTKRTPRKKNTLKSTSKGSS